MTVCICNWCIRSTEDCDTIQSGDKCERYLSSYEWSVQDYREYKEYVDGLNTIPRERIKDIFKKVIHEIENGLAKEC